MIVTRPRSGLVALPEIVLRLYRREYVSLLGDGRCVFSALFLFALRLCIGGAIAQAVSEKVGRNQRGECDRIEVQKGVRCRRAAAHGIWLVVPFR